MTHNLFLLAILGFSLGNCGTLPGGTIRAPYPELKYTISKTWDNKTTADEIHISFQIVDEYDVVKKRGLVMKIDAPFYDDPAISSKVPTDQPTLGLWNYEVVEAFFHGADDEYLEIELGPKGHYILLFLKGKHNLITYELPLTNYTATFSTVSGRWLGHAYIPGEYFPCRVNRFNSYAIHKSSPGRVHMALFPVDNGFEGPDFHNLESFGDIDLGTEINPRCGSSFSS